ncbi:MAG: MerR family DNA-binding transcriptional regulator [Pseudomonadota bacterium]
MAETRLSFKEMCAKFDVTPRTLRYYEYIELLSPERQGRSRFYGPKEIARMTLILRGRRWGFSLEDLRQWLLIYENEGSDKQLATFVEYADRQIRELRERQVELEQVIGELEGLKASICKDLGAA